MKKVTSEYPFIYFDNNATTFMPTKVRNAMHDYELQGNPSADYAIAKRSKELILKSKQYIAELCSASLDDYHIVYTSGATEGNITVYEEVAASYKEHSGIIPHIIVSGIEHHSSLECLYKKARREEISLTVITPEPDGSISTTPIQKAIRKNTALISVMAVNNETGVVNPIAAIATLAHKHGIPFHSDCVQLFGKMIVNFEIYDLDFMTASFHKLYGPPSIGLLIIKKEIYKAYHMEPLICGSQNDGLRGGTENVALIAGSYEAMQINFNERKDKTDKLIGLVGYFISQLARLPFNLYRWSDGDRSTSGINICLLSHKTSINTVLITIFTKSSTKVDSVCNKKMKEYLDRNHILISIGSACDKGKPSHVLKAMKIPDELITGTLRISFGDINTKEEINMFMSILPTAIKSCK